MSRLSFCLVPVKDKHVFSSIMENSVDSYKMASLEANISESTIFFRNYIFGLSRTRAYKP